MSPVSMTVLVTPAALSAAMASREWGFSMSEMTMWPAYSPFTAIWTMVPTLWHACHATPSSSMSLPFPAATVTPSTTAVTPRPLCS